MKKKALFLDRDGVVNIDKSYLYKREDFVFVDGIFKLCENFKDYYKFIITNQSGIARGFYTKTDFLFLTRWMLYEFKRRNIIIHRVYFCPHHPDFTGECECRKPKGGMIRNAQKDFDIDIENSILIGDSLSDVECGVRLGIKKLFLLGKEKSTFAKTIKNLSEVYDG